MKSYGKRRTAFILATLLAITALSGCGTRNSSKAASGGGEVNPSETSRDDVFAAISELSDEEYEAAYLQEPASARTIHIGYDGGLCQAAVALAHELGFFAAEGLDTTLVKSDSAREALVGGHIDTSTGMIAAWLKSITSGVDIVFTAGLHTGCASAVVLADSEIQTFEDALGRSVGVAGDIGGVYHNIAYRMIAHDGLATDDFTWKAITADQGLLILQSSETDVIVLGDQIAEQWVQEGLVRRIRSTTLDADFSSEACCALGISGDFIRENPITAEKISRAVYRASLWLQESEENRYQGAQVLLDNGHISGTADYAVALMNLYTFGLSNELTEKSLYDSVDEYKLLGVIDEDIDADALKVQIWQPFDLERLSGDK